MIATSAGWRHVAVPPSDRLCVYAIVSGGASPSAFRAREGERLRLIRHGRLAAVVRKVPHAPAPTTVNLRRYDRTMQAIAKRFDAMLPARFGTCVSREELIFILSSRRAALAPALARVRGRVQMTVRLVGDGPHRPPPSDTRPPSGVDYLRARSREAAVPEFDPLRATVRRWVRAEHVDRRGGVATVYHLIPRSSVDAYRAAVQRAGAAGGLHLIVSGPWPPYAFAAD